jgi:hypothetical protein
MCEALYDFLRRQEITHYHFASDTGGAKGPVDIFTQYKMYLEPHLWFPCNERKVPNA